MAVLQQLETQLTSLLNHTCADVLCQLIDNELAQITAEVMAHTDIERDFGMTREAFITWIDKCTWASEETKQQAREFAEGAVLDSDNDTGDGTTWIPVTDIITWAATTEAEKDTKDNKHADCNLG